MTTDDLMARLTRILYRVEEARALAEETRNDDGETVTGDTDASLACDACAEAITAVILQIEIDQCGAAEYKKRER